MAELIIHVGGPDAALLTRLLDDSGGVLPLFAVPSRPARIVVDAATAAWCPGIARTARAAGVPLLVDPETFYLQDHQHPADPWAGLPFADPAVASVADLLNPGRADRLVADCLEFQLTHGATALVVPYVHLGRAGDGWAEVQAGLYRRTRRYLDHQGLRLPVIAPVALGWQLLSRAAWPHALNRMIDGLRDLDPTEVALAASSVDAGTHPQWRLAELYAVIDRLRTSRPVLAWAQGVLGEACVAAGAAGYETGIGWRERCDLPRQMTNHRTPPHGNPGARPVYITALGRSLPKRTVAALLEDPVIAPQLACLEYACCPTGRRTLTGDARAHAVISRLRRLNTLTAAQHPRWAWQHLAADAGRGLELASRINTNADHRPDVRRVDTAALRATAVTADNRRHTARKTRAA